MAFNVSGNNAYTNMSKFAQNNVQEPLNVKKEENTSAQAAVNVSEVEHKIGGKGFTIAGVSIGGALLLGVIGFACLSKGTSGSLYKRMKRYSLNLKRKSYDLATNYKNLTIKQKLKLGLARTIEPVPKCLEASSNMNVFKDGFTMFMMKKLRLTKVVNGINGVFKNIVLKTKNSAYKDAELSNVKFCSYLEKLSKDSRAQGKGLENFGENIARSYSESFSLQNHYNRSENIWESLSNLHERVWNSFKIFSKKDNIFNKTNRQRLKSYITMDMCEPERRKVLELLKNNKSALSNNIADNHHVLKETLNNLKTHIDPGDARAVKLMHNLEGAIVKYEKLGGANESLERQELCKETMTIIRRLKSHLNVSKDFDAEKLLEPFSKVLDTNTSKKGQVQEALTELKEIFGKNSKEYKEAKKLADEFNKNMNNAISTEMTAYEKFAELQMGSAPTDILGILAPTALGTALVIRAKDKDQRITNTLTQGIPILGGIGTAYYGTTRMLTGPTNMALGLISGALLSVIGSKVDEMYKNYQSRQHTFRSEFEALKKAHQAAAESAKDAANLILKPGENNKSV